MRLSEVVTQQTPTGTQLRTLLEQEFGDIQGLLAVLESLRCFADEKAKILEMEAALVESWSEPRQPD